MMRDAQIHDQGDRPNTVCKIGQLDVSTRLRATCEDLTLAVVLKSSASCFKVQSCAFLAPQHPSERYTCSQPEAFVATSSYKRRGWQRSNRRDVSTHSEGEQRFARDWLTRLHPSNVGGHHQAMGVYQCTCFVRFSGRALGCLQ